MVTFLENENWHSGTSSPAGMPIILAYLFILLTGRKPVFST